MDELLNEYFSESIVTLIVIVLGIVARYLEKKGVIKKHEQEKKTLLSQIAKAEAETKAIQLAVEKKLEEEIPDTKPNKKERIKNTVKDIASISKTILKNLLVK